MTSLLIVVIPILTLGTAAEPPRDEPNHGWIRLFNGRDLDGWYTFLQEHGKDKDPDGIITITEQETIHLYANVSDGSRVVMGYIGTNQEFGDYHLRLQYRWGVKKFEPRYDLKRDAGLYYHILGEDAVWPRSLQYQIQETDVGDLLALYGVQLDTWINPETSGEGSPTFLDHAQGGQAHVLGGEGIGYQQRLPGPFETDGWNTIEILVKDDTSLHLLNGQVVNRAENIRLVDPERPGESRPVTKGRIALEIEAAEIEFRNVEIRMLDE